MANSWRPRASSSLLYGRNPLHRPAPGSRLRARLEVKEKRLLRQIADKRRELKRLEGEEDFLDPGVVVAEHRRCYLLSKEIFSLQERMGRFYPTIREGMICRLALPTIAALLIAIPLSGRPIIFLALLAYPLAWLLTNAWMRHLDKRQKSLIREHAKSRSELHQRMEEQKETGLARGDLLAAIEEKEEQLLRLQKELRTLPS